MKKWVYSKKDIIDIEWDLEIIPVVESIESSVSLDPNDKQFKSFIHDMVTLFSDYGYELYNDPDYTHQSNKGSQSWYYTFLRIENQVEIRIVVNVRISDHANSDKAWGTAAERREKYITKVRDELEQLYQVHSKPMRTKVDIIFNDEEMQSYMDALFEMRDKLEDTDAAYKKWLKRHPK